MENINILAKYKSEFLLLIPFLLMSIGAFVVSDQLIWDERFFYPIICEFGSNYLPSLDQIQNMKSPMGPLFFILFGLVGKLVDFSIPALRVVNILLSYGLIILLYRIMKAYTPQALLFSYVFILNPYFCSMCASLIYTDVLAVLLSFFGVFYYSKDKRLFAAIFFGLAICTRQFMIVFPIAAGIIDLILIYRRDLKILNIFYWLIPLIIFLPLFILWDGPVSIYYSEQSLHVNNVSQFDFSFKKIIYYLMLMGGFAIPVLCLRAKELLKWNNLIFVGLAIVLMILGFPREINGDLINSNLPSTAGLLDILMLKSGVFSFLLIPILLTIGLYSAYIMVRKNQRLPQLLFVIILMLYLLLMSLNSVVWDKYFIPMIPLIFILLSKNKENEEFSQSKIC